jgi:hypothetical protein
MEASAQNDHVMGISAKEHLSELKKQFDDMEQRMSTMTSAMRQLEGQIKDNHVTPTDSGADSGSVPMPVDGGCCNDALYCKGRPADDSKKLPAHPEHVITQ